MRELGRTPAIFFPATQVASADPNALDDYEEGTFTPGISFAGAMTGNSYSAQVGRYTKIGRQVFVEGRVTLSAKGTSLTGSATITGLPFPALSLVPAGPFRYLSVSLGTGFILGGYLNGSVIALQIMGASGCADMTYAMATSTTDIAFAAIYATS